MNFEDYYKKALSECYHSDHCDFEEFSSEKITQDMKYLCSELIRVNKVMNLTAITDVEGIVYRHLIDCLWAARFIPKGSSVVDVGCGGGFPTLPLAIARPDLRITAVDSTAKKLEFVKGIASQLSLNVTTVAARAEELGNDPIYRESFDVAISRAVARLSILNELCLPLVRVGGLFLAMKGQDHATELLEAKNGAKKLGAGAMRDVEFEIENAGVRSVIRMEKAQSTPKGYPRAYAKMKKSPLI